MRLRSQHRRHRVLIQARSNKQAAQSHAIALRACAGPVSPPHRVLARQLKNLELDPLHPPHSAAAWQHFLERIDRAYQDADQDRYLLERSLAISSREMQELYDNLRHSSESQLGTERNKLRAVISAVGAGLCTLDLEGRVLSVNPEARRLLGCAEEDLLGVCFFERVETSWHQPGLAECPDTKTRTLVAAGEPHHEPNGTFTRKDGARIPVSYTITPIMDGGRLRGAALVFFDLTERKEAEAALCESEQRFRDLFENSPDAIFVEDFAGTVLDVNPVACALHGLAREQLIGLNVADLAPSDQREDVVRQFARLVAGEVSRIEGYSQTQTGDAVPVEIRVSHIVYAGQPALLLHVHDINEQRQAQEALQESERRYRTIVEHAAEAIVVFDVETGRFVDSNTNAEMLYGLSREALHQTGPEAMSPEYQPDGRLSVEAAREEIMRAVAGEVRIFEWTHRNAHGREIPCEVGLVRMPSADRVLVRGSITDITERKRFEQEIIKAREKAEEMSHLKSAFLNNMSHEIRTPLTAIIGFSAILSEETSPQQRELVDLIEQSGKRLLNTLNAVLDLSMLETGSLSVENEWFDLVEAVEEKVMSMLPFAREKNIALDLVTPAPRMPVHLDRACLDRILTHLIDNAIKFTHEGSVTVALVREDGRVCVRVEDTGVGIGPAFQPYLFDDFKQESTGLARAHEGAGLGLAVTRRMVNLMKGAIAVESEKDKGSVFGVSFAQPMLTNGAHPASRTPDANRPKPCILVVEDTPEIELLVEYMLSDVYDVMTTPHEEGALAMAGQQRFDLVLMDINLGGARTGVDVMDALRDLPSYHDVPIVAMTAYALLEDRTRFLAAGFDGYLSKPFTAHQAIDTIRHLLPVNGKA